MRVLKRSWIVRTGIINLTIPPSPSPPGLQPPVQLQTAGLLLDPRPVQALVGLHLGLLLLGDPLSHLAPEHLLTLTVDRHPQCPLDLTAHPQVYPGE